MKSLVLRVGLPVLFGTFLAVSGNASPIFVNNFSFETTPAGGLPFSCGPSCAFNAGAGAIPGWTITGASNAGEFQPGPPTNLTFYNTIPDGVNIAYSDGADLTQGVGTITAGLTYTLLVDVGLRNDFLFDNVPETGIEYLQIGGPSGTKVFATGTLASPGGWSTYTATFTATAADNGKTLDIVLSAGSHQGNWDNVRLDASGASTSAVPEPLTSVMIGFGAVALGLLTRRKRA